MFVEVTWLNAELMSGIKSYVSPWGEKNEDS